MAQYLPYSLPANDPSSLWAIQQLLLAEAEKVLGRRDSSKTICQPTFADTGPRTIITTNCDGAFAQLSLAAQRYWPTVVYELAHETVHLLNPIAGYTTWLEEGVAVEFSMHAQMLFGLPLQRPIDDEYFEALQLVRTLPGGALNAGKKVREHLRRLHGFSAKELGELFPTIDSAVLNKLAETCIPR